MTPLEQAVVSSRRLAETTRAQYLRVVRDFIAFAGVTPESWTPIKVELWRDQLGVEPVSQNAYLAALRYASRRFAALFDQRDFAGAAESVLVPAEKHPRSPRALTEEEISTMLATCGQVEGVDLRDRALIAIALHAGFRRAELSRMDLSDLDSSRNSIVVIAKRNRRHAVRVSEACWGVIAAWTQWLARRRIREGPVFRVLRRCLDAEAGYAVGGRLSPRAVYRVIRRRGVRAGLSGVSPHCLRHSCAALLRARGVDESRIQRQLGHAHVTTTALYGGAIELEPVGDDFPA